jgi:hypothetical protein
MLPIPPSPLCRITHLTCQASMVSSHFSFLSESSPHVQHQNRLHPLDHRHKIPANNYPPFQLSHLHLSSPSLLLSPLSTSGHQQSILAVGPQQEHIVQQALAQASGFGLAQGSDGSRPGSHFPWALAPKSRAQAGAFRPSQAGTSLNDNRVAQKTARK